VLMKTSMVCHTNTHGPAPCKIAARMCGSIRGLSCLLAPYLRRLLGANMNSKIIAGSLSRRTFRLSRTQLFHQTTTVMGARVLAA
jgi:hypothetical protein